MKWDKLGLIFCADHNSDLMVTAAHAPVPIHLEGDIFRIYFGSYDSTGRSRIYYLELNIENPREILYLSSAHVLDIGASGFFDDNGVLPSDIVRLDSGEIYLYTIGFSIKNKLTFDAAIGLAISSNNGQSFNRLTGPVLDRTPFDPCFSTSPAVLFHGNNFTMWYVSGEYWKENSLFNHELKHYYNIKRRVSADGINWHEDKPSISIDYSTPYEYAIARPTVLVDESGEYKMWFCFRAQDGIDSYRIGYATSSNGVDWIRQDELAGIDVSSSGWDSQMICYPKVFKHKDNLYMLYNGNGFGKSGFGLAVMRGG